MTDIDAANAQELFDEGKKYFDEKQYVDAERCFREASDLEPTNSQYMAWLARVTAGDKDRLDEASQLAHKALEVDSNSAVAYFVLGRIANIRGDQTESLNMYNRSVRADSTFRSSYRNIYYIHAEAEKWQWQLAFPPFLRWLAPDLSIVKTDTVRWLKLTETALENENYHEVYQYSTRILEEDPDSWLGLCYKSLAAPEISTPDRVRLQELSNGLRRVFAGYEGDSADISWLSTIGAAGVLRFLYKIRDGFVQQQEDYVGLHARPTRDNTIQTNVGAAFGQGVVNAMNERAENNRQRQVAAEQLGARFTSSFQEPIVSAFETCWAQSQLEATADNICYSVEAVTYADSLSWNSKKAYRDRIAPLLAEIGVKYPEMVEKISPLEQEKSDNGGCSPCFVATAVMGDFDHPTVVTLREYRDQVLLKSGVGRGFVKLYYRFSPPLADWIARSDQRRRFFYRILIAPLTEWADKKLQHIQ